MTIINSQIQIAKGDIFFAQIVSERFDVTEPVLQMFRQIYPVWPDCVIYCTLGNFSKHVATINLPKLPSLLSNFCKGIKIFHFSSEIIFGQLL